MKRFTGLFMAFLLMFGLFTSQAQAVVVPNDEVLFSSNSVAGAISELEKRLNIRMIDNTHKLSLTELRDFETAVNYLSADLLCEALEQLNDVYGVELQVIFQPNTGQDYLGVTTLKVNREIQYLAIEYIEGEDGFTISTMVHELCHLIHYALVDMKGNNLVEPLFYQINGDVPYQDKFDFDRSAWRQYIDRLSKNGNYYFVREYAGTDVYEDFACLFEAVAIDSDYWERTLLRTEYAPLRAKYAAATGILNSSFESGSASPLGDLYPADWAIEEWQEARELALISESLDRCYDQPITRREFCELMVNVLDVLWGKDAAEVILSNGVRVDWKPFSDTDDKNVALLYALGIVNGLGDGRFGPDMALTRQEAAKLLTQTALVAGLKLSGSQGTVFLDNATIAPWAQEYVEAVSAAGLMSGTGNGRFAPTASYDRQQSFLTALRLYKLAV